MKKSGERMELAGKKIAMIASIESSFILLFANQLKQLSEKGVIITAISSLENPGNLEFFKNAGLEFIEIPIERQISLIADLIAVFRLVRIFRKKRFDLIHTQTPKPTLLGAIAGKLSGIPVINTARPIFREMPEGWRRKFFIFLEKVAGRLAALVMVENPADFDLYLGLGMVPKEKLKIQGNGIDLSRFDPEKIPESDLARLRAELGLPENALVIGCVARYVYEKGYLELFQAFRRLKPKYPQLYLLTAGFFLPSERDPIPRDLPEKMGISDRLIMLENRSDMERLYGLMDIVVLPTHRDCFPRTLIEASAMAKPIIATDLVGCRVVVKPEETGILVPAKDAQALQQALERLIRDKNLASALGQRARKYALENLNEEMVCKRIIDCYAELLSG